MSTDAMYTAMREFIREAVKVEVLKATIETRAALLKEIPKEGPPGKDGKDGRDGQDGKNGIDGRDGSPGKDGERGADGVATVEQIEAVVEQRAAAFQARSLADWYQGVYDNGKDYKRGDLVTWGGQLWLGTMETRSVPGVGPEWRLLVKKGRDAK